MFSLSFYLIYRSAFYLPPRWRFEVLLIASMNNLIDGHGWVTVWLWIGSYVSVFLYVCTQCRCVYVIWLDLSMNYLHRRIDPKAYIVLRTQRKYSWKFLSNIIKRLYCISFCKKLIKVLLWYCLKFWNSYYYDIMKFWYW